MSSAAGTPTPATGALHIADARRFAADGECYVAVTLLNGSGARVGEGGLRMLCALADGATLGLSIANHWWIGSGASVYLTAFLPRDGLKHIDFVDYLAFDGTVHALGDRLTIGWFGSELKRGTAGAHVET